MAPPGNSYVILKYTKHRKSLHVRRVIILGIDFSKSLWFLSALTWFSRPKDPVSCPLVGIEISSRNFLRGEETRVPTSLMVFFRLPHVPCPLPLIFPMHRSLGNVLQKFRGGVETLMPHLPGWNDPSWFSGFPVASFPRVPLPSFSSPRITSSFRFNEFTPLWSSCHLPYCSSTFLAVISRGG